MSNLITITPDNSSLQDKINSLSTFQYYYRNRWESAARCCALSSNNEYSRLLLVRKKEIESASQCVYNARRNKTISSKIYKSIPNRNILFASVTSCNNNENLDTTTIDSFVSTYALLTNNSFQTTVRGGQIVSSLDFIQLSRYDPREEVLHQNDLSFIDSSEQDAYLYYFGLQAPTPHMHFASLDNAIAFGNSTRLAINLFKLLEYIMDLIQNNPRALISDFNMPYRIIKDNPRLYKTRLYDSNIVDCLNLSKNLSTNDAINNIKNAISTTKTKQSQKVFNNLLNSCDEEGVELYGLEAVFMDLWSLACMHFSENLDLADELALALKIISGGSNNAFEHRKENTYGL